MIPQYCIVHLYWGRFSRHEHAHERVWLNNERDFSQAKLESEMLVFSQMSKVTYIVQYCIVLLYKLSSLA